MKRIIAYSVIVLLILAGMAWLAFGQVPTGSVTNVFVIPASGDCDTTVCTSGSRTMCREGPSATVLYVCNTATGFYIPVASAGAGNPGGSDKQVQVNSGGSFAGTANLLYDQGTGITTIIGGLQTCSPTAFDYCLETRLSNKRLWLNSSGLMADSNWATWDATDDRWEASNSSSIVAPSVTLYGYDGTIKFYGAAMQTYAAGDPLTFNLAMNINTSAVTPVITLPGITKLSNVLGLTALSSLPATCTQGDFANLTNGATCHCFATNSWENTGSQGVCQ